MPLRRVGWIGLGAIWSRMARNLIKAGFEVAVWNRTPARAEELGRSGAVVKASPVEVAAGSDVVVTMVADPAAVAAVARGEQGLLTAAGAGRRFVWVQMRVPAGLDAQGPRLGPGGGARGAGAHACHRPGGPDLRRRHGRRVRASRLQRHPTRDRAVGGSGIESRERAGGNLKVFVHVGAWGVPNRW